MRIAVIGAGFTGLSVSYQLLKNGHEVTLFEKDSFPGGLALGFRLENWQWSLEKHYHHWFSNDDSVLALAKELNFETITKRPKTSVFVKNKIYQLDSPFHVLTFPKLKVQERLRMATVLALLRSNPFWQILEGIKTTDFLSAAMGKEPYKKIWEPQLQNKFGNYMNEISLAWFWARIRKRTAELVYPKGGFLEFANTFSKDAVAFTEIILGLPGDSKETHFNSLRYGIDNGAKILRMYQAMLLSGTAMASGDMRKEFQYL
ncbi:MAG: FAD-dependent oxidoreductase, partial [bacterium]|nr:FAD-dependent oxidoreductase [bacterium]